MAKRGGDREEENGINQIARNRVQRIYIFRIKVRLRFRNSSD